MGAVRQAASVSPVVTPVLSPAIPSAATARAAVVALGETLAAVDQPWMSSVSRSLAIADAKRQLNALARLVAAL